MKRILSLVVLSFAVFACYANGKYVVANGIYYEIQTNFARVVSDPSGNPYAGAVTIVSSVTYQSTQYPVTTINANAFYNCSTMTSVSIPSSVTTIDRYAFCNCTGLTSVSIPANYIGQGAFQRCTNLTNITFSASLTSIGRGAFIDCSSLTSLYIPASVTTIYDDSFLRCGSNLNSITVNSNNTVFDSRDNCNALIRKSTKTLLLGCKNTTVPSTVKRIGACAFYDCKGLTSVNIPSGVDTIKYNAFYGCSGLTSLSIPSSIKSICFGPSYTASFEGCTGLNTITVSSNSYYDSRDNCNAIIETSTNTLLFGCKNTTIPRTVTTIGDYAFNECIGLTSITIPNNVTKIDSYAFRGCSGLTSITIPYKTTYMGFGAFSNCSGLTSATLPKSLKYIPYSMFSGCANLTALSIPDSVASIGELAFKECESLTSIVIPSSVETINDGVLYGCTNIKSVYFTNSSMPSIGELFGYTTQYMQETPEFHESKPTSMVFYVPGNSISEYKTALDYHGFPVLPMNYGDVIVTVTSNDYTMGNVTGSGTYNIEDLLIAQNNNVVTIAAIPEDGYIFKEWNDGDTQNPRAIVLTSDTTFQAIFAPIETGTYNAIIDDYSVYAKGRTIFVHGASDQPVYIYDMLGKLVATNETGSDEVSFVIPIPGIYMVKIGDSHRILKVIVK